MQFSNKILTLLTKMGVKNGATKPKRLLRLALVLIVFALLIFAAQLWNSSQPIKSISISGTSYLSAAEVKAAIDDKAIINVPKNKIKYKKIVHGLKTNPYIAETFMHEGIHTLEIEVVERNPVAIIANSYGELSFADKDGKILPYRLFRSYMDLPVISGVYRGDKLDSSALAASIQVVRKLNDSEKSFLANLISEVSFNLDKRTISLYTSDAGTKIILGTTGRLENKLSSIAQFFKHRLTKPDKDLLYIDARWDGHIVAKYKDLYM